MTVQWNLHPPFNLVEPVLLHSNRLYTKFCMKMLKNFRALQRGRPSPYQGIADKLTVSFP